MSKIEEIDKNFAEKHVDDKGLVYYNCIEEPFSLHGFVNPVENGAFARLPLYFADCEEICGGVRRLMFNTSGGRVRFKTDSKIVAIRAELGEPKPMNHMSVSGSRGFDLYSAQADSNEEPVFKKMMVSTELTYNISHEFDDSSPREITIHFPLYNDVKSLYIGICENSTLEKPRAYSTKKPFVIYGSSVSQGACASRPGANYPAILSRWLDADFINLGFSGNDRGEEALAHYIATLDMSAFIYGYGYNAPTVEHYEKTYYPFYEIVRKKNPNLPIIMMSPPVCRAIKSEDAKTYVAERRRITLESFEKAKKSGDNNIYFIDGYTLLENPDSTVDCTHPTDLGFYEMATKICPVLSDIIKGNKRC